MTIRNVRQWTRKERLAGVALMCGLIALGAGDPYTGGTVTLSTDELALIIQQEEDHVDPSVLAEWIIAKRADYRLIDLRSDSAYATYRIPGAEQMQVVDLASNLTRNERIVLYSDGGIHAAQAWMLLKARKYGSVYTLRGGLEGWKDEVLFPVVVPSTAEPERNATERKGAVSRFFGGQPRSSDGIASAPSQPVIPKLEMPNAPVKPAAGGKKKKEGC